MGFKKTAKSIKKKINELTHVKTPIPYPVMQGTLLKGRNAIITGGSSGIGFAIAESFLKNGANVTICGRNEAKLVSAVKQLNKIAGDGQEVDYLTLDMMDVAQIEKDLSNYTKKKSFDILVNNAGIGNGSPIGKTSIEDFEAVIKTNLEGTYYVSQFALNYMKSKKIKGNIFFVASSSSLRPANTPYILSKWGILGLVKGLAKVGIKDGIVVNGIAPGPTATAMLQRENTKDISYISNPAGRLAMPEEIANLSTVLVSDMGKMVVGDVLFASGGAGVITFDDVNY
jgi:3-oxoacyl-[acyl-carrier protein] reductase